MCLGQEVHYYMVYIAYFTELILQICDYALKSDVFDAKNVNTRLTKIFIAIFAPDERLPRVGSTDRLLNYVWYGSGAGRLRTFLRAIL